MKIVSKIGKWILYVLLIPITYLVLALTLSAITVDRKEIDELPDKRIYLSTNGVHLNIIIPSDQLDSALLAQINQREDDIYVGFGWGDEQFYLNTPNWEDLTFKNAFRALFMKSASLVHVNRYSKVRSDWVAIDATEAELEKLIAHITQTFETDETSGSIIHASEGYTSRDDFYKALGSYSFVNTCNTWVNTGFKRSGLKACVWTPFDFGVMNKYE